MPKQALRVMIDPGHGGKKPGAVYGHVNECDINAALARLLAGLLMDMGCEVQLSRPLVMKPGDWVPVWERAKMANAMSLDVFISLHSNASRNPDARGVRFYVHRRQDPLIAKGASAEALAGALQTQAMMLLQPDTRVGRIVPRDNLTVLKRTSMPAVLVETGFMSNDDDRALLLDNRFLWRAAVAYAAGLWAWARRNVWRDA